MAFLAERALELLVRSHEQGRLAHAYLVAGPPGSGKKRLALGLMQRVTGGRPESLEAARSEFVQIVAPESKSRRIRVDAMRAVERRLHLAAPKTVTKIAVILDADRLGPEAANAFLKTLEEPPPQSLLLLLTSRPGMLLDTTRSRCIQVPLFVPAAAQPLRPEETRLLELLRERPQQNEGGVGAAACLLQGFTDILKACKKSIQEENDAALKEEKAFYKQTTEGDWLKQREEYYKGITEALYLERRDALVQVLVSWFGEALRTRQGLVRSAFPGFEADTARVAKTCDERELLRRLDALEELRENLQTNVNESLALEAGFLVAFA